MAYVAAARVWELGAGVRGLWFRTTGWHPHRLGGALCGQLVRGRPGHRGAARGRGAGRSATLLVRRFLATPGAFVEAQVGGGREVVTLGAGPLVDVRRSAFVAARVFQRVSGPLWLTAGAGYTDEEVSPRASATLGLDVRW